MAKPFGLRELKLLLERVGAHLNQKVESRRLSERIKSEKGFGKIIGRAPEMDTLYRIIGKAALPRFRKGGTKEIEAVCIGWWRRCTIGVVRFGN